jgi:hypothetical protein
MSNVNIAVVLLDQNVLANLVSVKRVRSSSHRARTGSAPVDEGIV